MPAGSNGVLPRDPGPERKTHSCRCRVARTCIARSELLKRTAMHARRKKTPRLERDDNRHRKNRSGDVIVVWLQSFC